MKASYGVAAALAIIAAATVPGAVAKASTPIQRSRLRSTRWKRAALRQRR